MSLLNDSDLEYMRTVENLAMSSTAVIYRPNYSAGAFGSVTQSWVAQGTVSCDVWPISRFDREKSSGNQEISRGEFYVSVPYNTDVLVTDKLVINNINYEVTFVPLSQSWLTNLRLEVRNYNGQ